MMNPQILTHPNIPKPLHGLNPRTILGKEWWDKERFAAQAQTNYTCYACGIKKEEAKKHKWLEGHENFDINYQTGVCEVKSIVPLCHYCHNFIHSGRLAHILGKEKSKQEVIEILEHGFKILSENNLQCFFGTLYLGNSLNCNTFQVSAYSTENSCVPWGKWCLLLDGKKYYSKFKNYSEWKSFYGH